MSSFVQFQNQLVSILEILAKAAVAEINRCVDDSCAVIRLEISQSQTEIETLKRKLGFLQRELHKTQRQKTENVFGQDWRFRPMGGENRMVMEDAKMPLLPSINCDQSRSELLPVKLERMEDDLSLDQQHTVSRGELSGLEFVVKAEQEEEHVAQRLNQTGCELSAGRLNTLDSEYVMYERDNQLCTSFTQGNSDAESNELVCSNATEQCSQGLSSHCPRHQTPAALEVSVNTLSTLEASCPEFEKMDEMPSVCREDLRSEAIHTQQGHYRGRLVHTVERENQTSLSQQQQQHEPSVKHRRGGESPAQPHLCTQYETSSSLSTGAVNTGKRVGKETRADFGREQFVCKYCGKTYYFHCNLMEHQRFHTGEKPYSCAHCGRCFKRKSHLVDHEKLHSGYRPFVCTQCGKRFARGTHLRRHQRIHT